MKRLFICLTILWLLISSSCNETTNHAVEEIANNNLYYSGIISLVEDANSDPSIAFDMPFVDGVKLRLGWRNVEPLNNEFDWTLIDSYIKKAQELNKQLSISIAGGATSPQWLIDKLHVDEYVQVRGSLVPKLWNEVYVNEYIEMVKAFASRYNYNIYASHITISGIGFSNEPVIPSPYGVANLAEWAVAANKIVDAYVTNFTNKPLTLAVHTQVPNEDTWAFFKENIIDVAYQKSETIGLEYHGLDATASPNEGTIADNYYNEIIKISDSRHVGYQFVCSTIANPVCDPNWVKGSSNNTQNLLQRTLEAGVRNGAHFIEVYANDCSTPLNYELFKKVSEELRTNKIVQ